LRSYVQQQLRERDAEVERLQRELFAQIAHAGEPVRPR
jgi:hypothetical protein